MTTSKERAANVSGSSSSSSPVDIKNAAASHQGNLPTVEVAGELKTTASDATAHTPAVEDYAGIGRGLWGDSAEEAQRQIDADHDSWRR